MHARASDLVEKRFASDGFRTRRDAKDRLFIQRGDAPEYHVAVIGARSHQYHYVVKKRLQGNRVLVALVWVPPGSQPTYYLIPAHAFRAPAPGIDRVIKDRNYEGLKSEPEYGLNLAPENALTLLSAFDFDQIARRL